MSRSESPASESSTRAADDPRATAVEPTTRPAARQLTTPGATWRLVRDELVGFARSKVMLVLYVVLPGLALGGFLLLGERFVGAQLTATAFMSVIESSVAGAVGALMIAVDIVSERNRNVYVLLAVRPIRRETILWAKLIAVFVCVAIACAISLLLGIAVDALRGHLPTLDTLHATARALASTTAVIGLSASAGALIGSLTRSILAAVILVLYVGQNVAAVPMLPVYFGFLPQRFWLFMVFSYGLVAVLAWLAGVAFRRLQL